MRFRESDGRIVPLKSGAQIYEGATSIVHGSNMETPPQENRWQTVLAVMGKDPLHESKVQPSVSIHEHQRKDDCNNSCKKLAAI